MTETSGRRRQAAVPPHQGRLRSLLVPVHRLPAGLRLLRGLQPPLHGGPPEAEVDGGQHCQVPVREQRVDLRGVQRQAKERGVEAALLPDPR